MIHLRSMGLKMPQKAHDMDCHAVAQMWRIQGGIMKMLGGGWSSTTKLGTSMTRCGGQWETRQRRRELERVWNI